jgi:hypothetical protein
MKGKTFAVLIKQHESKEATFVASYTSPFLSSTFSVEFPNSVFGAIGFHHFMDMLKTRYVGVHFSFRLPKELVAHPSVEALLSG